MIIVLLLLNSMVLFPMPYWPPPPFEVVVTVAVAAPFGEPTVMAALLPRLMAFVLLVLIFAPSLTLMVTLSAPGP